MDEEQIERERRSGRIAGIAGIVGIVLFVGIGLIGLAPDFRAADGLANSLDAFPSERSEILLIRIGQAAGALLFIAPLLSLFNTVRRRSEKLRYGLIGLCIAGPLFLAASILVAHFAFDAAADAFDSSTIGEDLDADEEAAEVYRDQSVASVASGLAFAGQLGMTFMMIYVSLNAMRVGLMTRFVGIFLMALAVVSLLLSQIAQLSLLMFFLAISLMVARFWLGGLPPAWDAGRAIPWLKPGESAPPSDSAEQLADPEDFEGSAFEVDAARPGRRDNRKKRKRKQRGA